MTEASAETADSGRRAPRTVGLDALWLETLQKVASRAAHELKGALNGVSVNLEVVRTRAARPDALASTVLRFADSAAQQLEGLIRMNESLLALARPIREPVDVGGVVSRLAALLGPSTNAEGGRLEIEDGASEQEALTSVRGNGVRLALAAVLLEAVERKAVTTCRIERVGEVIVHVTSSVGGEITMPPTFTDAVGAAGVRVDTLHDGCSLTFPRRGEVSEARAESE